MEGIKCWLEAEGAGHCFFYIFPIAVLLLLLILKKRRLSFVVPAVIIAVAVINPLFYRYWDEYGRYAYWRILWVVPVIPVVAAVIPAISEKTTIQWSKAIAAAVGVGVIALSGTYLYNGPGGSFVEAANAEKIPNDVVQIAHRLLEMNDHPRIIAQDPVGVYIRQCSGEITTLYGRDVSGYILPPSDTAREIHESLNAPDGDMGAVSQFMLDDGYDYLVYSGDAGDTFQRVDTVAGYGIYQPLGTPAVRKTRNALGQITSVTYLDENGEPRNGDAGYATVLYDFDDYGNLIRIFQTDKDGNAVTDALGIAGREWEWDQHGQILKERFIDATGSPIACGIGYAEWRRAYENGDIVSEAYYDASGNRVNRTDVGFAEMRIEYDEDHNRIHEWFYDADGNEVTAPGL